MSRLRRVLGPERIVRSDAGYALAFDWLDVGELRGLAAVAAEARAEGRAGAAWAAAGAALALVRGPLLPDEDGEWVEAGRAGVGATIAEVQRLAVGTAVAAGDLDAAAALAEQALTSDPYDEVVLRALMEAHLAAGRPASALAAYARSRRRLAEDLGVPPTAETEALHGRALAAADGDVAPGVPSRHGAAAGLVGRNDELAVLHGAFSQAATLALVGGDAGAAAGLAAAVADDAAGRGAGRYELLGRAVLGLADRSIPPERLAPVIEGLARCAVLDGWPLVAALAASRRADTWRAGARRLAAAVVASAGAHGDAAGRFVDRLFTA